MLKEKASSYSWMCTPACLPIQIQILFQHFAHTVENNFKFTWKDISERTQNKNYQLNCVMVTEILDQIPMDVSTVY